MAAIGHVYPVGDSGEGGIVFGDLVIFLISLEGVFEVAVEVVGQAEMVVDVGDKVLVGGGVGLD